MIACLLDVLDVCGSCRLSLSLHLPHIVSIILYEEKTCAHNWYQLREVANKFVCLVHKNSYFEANRWLLNLCIGRSLIFCTKCISNILLVLLVMLMMMLLMLLMI